MKDIDCLLIGSYEMNFSKVESITRSFGVNSSVYRSLNLKYLYDGKPYAIFDLFKLCGKEVFDRNLPENGEKYEMFSNAIAYLGTYLNKRGYMFDFINSFLHEKEALAEKLQNDNILTIAIITTTYSTPFPIRDLVSFIRKYNTTAKICIGGPYIWGEFRTRGERDIELLMDSLNVDFYVDSSQGETALVEIIKALKNGNNFDHINNIRYKSGDKYIINKLVPENNELKDNTIDWSLFAEVIPNQVMVRTSLSCPFTCAFCEFPLRMGEYQYIDVSNIERELDIIEKIGKVRTVTFVDDTFNIPNSRFKEILKMMIGKKYSFKWSCLFRCQYADRETVELMAKSGCEAVHIGIESGSPTILKNMNKKATIEQFEYGMKLLNEYKIATLASFIIGFPGETMNTVQETIDFIERNKPTFFIVLPWYCSTVTPIWKEREKYNLTSQSGFNWQHSTMNSDEAIDIVEKIIFSIKNSIHSQLHIQQLTFFLSHGFTIDQISEFLIEYNQGLFKKINGEKQVAPEILDRMKMALSPITNYKL